MSFEDSYKRQIKFSKKTFGPYYNPMGLIDHIHQELIEIDLEPHILEEWIDVMILAFDGAWRLVKHHRPDTPDEVLVAAVCSAYESKCKKNRKREWPDWRTAEPGKAINHIKEEKEENEKIIELIERVKV